MAYSCRDPWSTATTTWSPGSAARPATTTTAGTPRRDEAARAAATAPPSAGTGEPVEHDVAPSTMAHTGRARASPIAADVGVRRGDREHGPGPGDRVVELGGDERRRRLEPPVALVADSARRPTIAAMPVTRRVMPAISDTTLMKRTPRYRHADRPNHSAF